MAETDSKGSETSRLEEALAVAPSKELLKFVGTLFSELPKEELEKVDSAFVVEALSPLILDGNFESAELASGVVSFFEEKSCVACDLQQRISEELVLARESGYDSPKFNAHLLAVASHAHCLSAMNEDIPEKDSLLSIARDIWAAPLNYGLFGTSTRALLAFEDGIGFIENALELDAIRGDSNAFRHYHLMKVLKLDVFFDKRSYNNVIDSALFVLRSNRASYGDFESAFLLSKLPPISRKDEFKEYGQVNVNRFKTDFQATVDTLVKAAVAPGLFYARLAQDNLTLSLKRVDSLLAEWIRTQYSSEEAVVILNNGKSDESASVWAPYNLVQCSYYCMSRYTSGAALLKDFVERADVQKYLDDVTEIVRPALGFISGLSDTYKQASGRVLSDPRGKSKFDDARSVIAFQGLYDLLLTVGKDVPECLSVARSELEGRFVSGVPVEYELDRMAFHIDDIEPKPRNFLLSPAYRKDNSLIAPDLYRGGI